MSTPDFNAVYRRCAPRVLALCLHMTGDRALAEDAFQETFLLVHTYLATFRGDSDVSTWVFRIALRVCARLRAHRLSTVQPSREAAHADTPLAAAQAAEQARLLAAALDTLDAGSRTVLALASVQELTGPEIAAVLDAPVGTVYSRIHRAREALRQALDRLRATRP